jgi:hypothetical protein
MRRWALVLAITVVAGHAAAHVAPSIDDNNRYLKVTPLGDRVRLAYTVFFGEIPGAKLRVEIDSDRDGAISDAEGAVFAKKLAAEVAASLDINVDGKQRPIQWAEISAGMGTPRTAAGAFSIDLIAYFCLTTPRGRHELALFDRLKIDRPGETEARVEDGPGITIERAKVGALGDPTYTFRFVGPSGPLAEDGLSVAFVAGEQAIVAKDAICRAGPARTGAPVAAIVGGVVLAGVLAGVGVLVARRKRRA